MRRLTVAFAEGQTTAIAFGAEGPPDLVFLHATGFNALTYRSLLEPLGQRFRIIALDQRGHGRCPLAARPEALSSWTAYVRDFLTASSSLWGGAPPPVIAGHSMGGAVALMAAARQPGLADRLVLFDPVMPPDGLRLQLLRWLPQSQRIARLPIAAGAQRRRDRFPSRAAARDSYRARGAFATWQAAFLNDYVEDGFADTETGDVRLTCTPQWEAATFAGVRGGVAAALKAIACPVEILLAARGSAVRVKTEQLRLFKADLRTETVSGSSHFLPMEVPTMARDRLERALMDRAARSAPLSVAAG
ncbi:alpha/beta fold hydrolase [Reyranella sp. CPCC 100927]|uniref:alpha/beta fold hydrolase n=1 Tax=Reyranella sp. CPCC 100927 TaxID=2599616 RepID=UPI0011B373EC|nr:alpha/beta hydrolase [Reyranella sp. CPCC 100927]TWS94444.1 alpha/beta hydrolase [Reyranella sp. CPCC 100927]